MTQRDTNRRTRPCSSSPQIWRHESHWARSVSFLRCWGCSAWGSHSIFGVPCMSEHAWLWAVSTKHAENKPWLKNSMWAASRDGLYKMAQRHLGFCLFIMLLNKRQCVHLQKSLIRKCADCTFVLSLKDVGFLLSSCYSFSRCASVWWTSALKIRLPQSQTKAIQCVAFLLLFCCAVCPVLFSLCFFVLCHISCFCIV